MDIFEIRCSSTSTSNSFPASCELYASLRTGDSGVANAGQSETYGYGYHVILRTLRAGRSELELHEYTVTV